MLTKIWKIKHQLNHYFLSTQTYFYAKIYILLDLFIKINSIAMTIVYSGDK